MHPRLRILTVAIVCVLCAAACGTTTSTGGPTVVNGFPFTFDNYGVQVTIKKPPRRVVLTNRNEVSLLEAVGALNTVVAKAGKFPPELYDGPTNATLNKIPTIGGTQSSTGTQPISLEAVLALNPDVVIGVLNKTGISRDALARSGIPEIDSLADSVACAPQNPDFTTVYDQVDLYGRVFNHQDQAAAAVAKLKARVAKVRGATVQGAAPHTATALFVPIGGGQISAYGTGSMVNADMTTVGLTNVFGDNPGRALETGFETVLARNPDDVIILTIGDLQAARDAFLSIPGVQGLNAVRNNHIMVMKFDYTDPPTPFSVDGLEKVAQAFGAHQ
ncbi:MAG: ABC transporter substrate-binding protein [Pseudonocardiaceae bacterium]